MSKIDIIRAWKDPSYRQSLSAAERALVPENPAGPVELYDADLSGGGGVAEFTYSGSFCTCRTKSVCTLCIHC
ncbi:MAG TPA: mersacidin/lichenicidin family type 2 lantibiotic [Enhygromyxa sp.]|nr:mersacidin/lichenicidin family type 2 lantibiotic [Enhygromyxa sp.]